jgi:cytochrome oxidase assembly protein ShyY1
MPAKFRFGWIPFIATLIVAAAGIALGQWQIRRAVEKETTARHFLAREAMPPVTLSGDRRATKETEYRRVIVRGEFVPNWTVYLDNRPHDGEAGFYVLTPLKIADANLYVLVVRGWMRRDPNDRTRLPSLSVPDGIVEIQGIARRNAGNLLQLGSPEPVRPHAILQNLDVQSFAQQTRLPMEPFLIEQSNESNDGLVRDWPKPSSGAERNRGYAFQWYALAATALVFFFVTGFRRAKND